ncbi:MAG: Phosphatidyl-N-methylethanolamine N-methyltransferase [Geoglossum umbratile]|nr:MAG: Phosphatidyl-N-methylethanolamine N-methyltransferase [Geoglossum umbratile]
MSIFQTPLDALVDLDQRSLLVAALSIAFNPIFWNYERALRDQPTHPLLQSPLCTAMAYVLLATGNILVLSSMWALGFTGTYLGDYFGILMDRRVTSFPFNVTGAPMYYGSTLSFLGTAFLYGKPAGVVLTVEVLVVYLMALRFEE